jgi:DNA-binding transcriptional ArsR family regulator
MSRRRSAATAALMDAAPVFAALGDPTRLRLVASLCTDGPQSIARLSGGVPITRQAVTKHLRALEGAGLVRDRRPGGGQRVWELEPRGLRVARGYLDRISAGWDDALARLKAMVED